MTDSEPFQLRGDASFFGDELPAEIELVHEDTGERRVLTVDPGGDA
jgi:hypothetical protein